MDVRTRPRSSTQEIKVGARKHERAIGAEHIALWGGDDRRLGCGQRVVAERA
jgi:hypothetical protein